MAEVWHSADGWLRIEVLEAPSAGLSGLTLVDAEATSWLYDVRQHRLQTGSAGELGIPLISEALEAIDWLFGGLDEATVKVRRPDTLESGQATRIDILLSSGDRAVLWVHNATGLPARVELHSEVWGEATFTARSLAVPERLPPDLFIHPSGFGSRDN